MIGSIRKTAAVALVASYMMTTATVAGAAGPSGSFASCSDVVAGAQCETVQVPVDWSRPGGPRVGLRIGRLAATNPA
ncbi:MAG: alpha/beta hydrolase, partial [Candidatus Dormibacteraceae bacterium]